MEEKDLSEVDMDLGRDCFFSWRAHFALANRTLSEPSAVVVNQRG